jgi:hypothetical protein
MAQPVTLYDPDKEMAVVIDYETGVAFAPVAAGENAKDLMEAFVSMCGVALEYLKPPQQMEMFRGFLTRLTTHEPLPADAAPIDEVGDGPRASMDAEAALAQHEANGATDTPPEQPADTDQAPDPAGPAVGSRCFNCNGEGMISFGDTSPAVQCNVCHGTGKMPAAAH